MGQRRIAREVGLQILFQIEHTDQALADVLPEFLQEHNLATEALDFFKELVEGVVRNRMEIDGIIESTSTNWKLSRMAAVDRNMLRLATFELLHRQDIPDSVTINEAVEIVKKFGTDESASFINGVLDKISKDHQERKI